jgi:hypothetical protein
MIRSECSCQRGGSPRLLRRLRRRLRRTRSAGTTQCRPRTKFLSATATHWSSPREKAPKPTSGTGSGDDAVSHGAAARTFRQSNRTEGERMDRRAQVLMRTFACCFLQPQAARCARCISKSQRCTSLCRARSTLQVNNRRRVTFDIERTRASTVVEADNSTLKSAR